ncbi:hypothetical protein [Aquabacterium sp.]|uniref:hypothetical protein n=1 Tax=Aquabacterium sp. TaxID=1872578 RepID=UPI002BD0DEFE|nr:hypothetical protein [Aquabacterium sp.]HSW05093.1 hypothetical protein [Aquabacterium sp.]
MNTTQTFIAAAVALAFIGTFIQASAQALPTTAGSVLGTLDGHAFETGSSATVPPAGILGGAQPYDLQIALSEGRHHADAKGVRLIITGTNGQKTFSLDEADALTDVDLPPGQYHVLADFGRVKRMGAVDAEVGRLATLYLHGPDEPG